MSLIFLPKTAALNANFHLVQNSVKTLISRVR